MFKPDLMLVQNDEYEIAYGSSDLVGEKCVGQRWAIKSSSNIFDVEFFPVEHDEPTWFPMHPALTKDQVRGLLTLGIKGKIYGNVVAVAMLLGIHTVHRRSINSSVIENFATNYHRGN